MEIVPIITYLLLFVFALLVVVIAISILFSNTHSQSERGGQDLILNNMEVINSKEKIYKNINFVPALHTKKYRPSSRESQIFYINKGREENNKLYSTQIAYQKQYRSTSAIDMRTTSLQSKPRFIILNNTYGNSEYSSNYNTYGSKSDFRQVSNSSF